MKAILVDLDNTLLDFSKSEKLSIEKVFEYYHIDNTEENYELYAKINQSYWEKLERGETTRTELVKDRFTDFFAHFHKTIDAEEVNKLYFTHLKECPVLYDDTISFLKTCQDNGYKICLCTNGVEEIQARRVLLSGLKKYFYKSYVSDSMKINKPDKAYFDYVLNDLSLTNKDVVMIGDSLTSDILGGKNSHIVTIWVNRNHQKSDLPDYTIESLNDFFSLPIEKNK